MRAGTIFRCMRGLFAAFAVGACFVVLAYAIQSHGQRRTILLEVVRNSWDVERSESLVYLRVYSDGFAEAHPMRRVDFRDILLPSNSSQQISFRL